jgi:hypothetical protein
MSAIGNVVNVATGVVYDPAGQDGYYMQINGGVYRSAPVDANDGEAQSFRINASGELYILNRVQNPLFVQGVAADNAAASGNPVRAAAKYNSGAQVYADGDVADLQADAAGKLHVRATELETLLTSIRDNADTVEALLTAIGSNTDGLEGFVDGVEALLTSIRDNADTVEALIGTTNTELAAVNAELDAVSTHLAGVNAELDTQTTALAAANASLDNIETQTNLSKGDGVKDATTLRITPATDSYMRIRDGNGNLILARTSGGFNALTMIPMGYYYQGIATHDHSSANITTSAYTTIVASTSAEFHQMEIFDSSGEALILAVGGAGSEVDKMYIIPGGNNGSVRFPIPSGSRISVKALTANTTSGRLIINFLG